MRNAPVAITMVIVLVLAFLAGLGSSTQYSPKTVSETTTVTDTFSQTVIILTTTSSTSCDYVIPSPCPSGQTFTLIVDYTGAWRVTYQGYNAPSCSDCLNNSTETLTGNYDGSGFNARNVTVSGQANGWTICAQAQKSDASSSVLVLIVSGVQNETSIAFGTASACEEEIVA